MANVDCQFTIDEHTLVSSSPTWLTSSSSSSSVAAFPDFPEDVQVSILSFLTPSEITSFSCTSKRFSSLCRCDDKLWLAMCERRWGSKTQIKKWGNGKIEFKLLYKTLDRWDNLIGFWRRSGQGIVGVASLPLVFFEWGTSFITGSRVSPCKSGTYRVTKTPFLWMGISSRGEPLNLLDPDCRFESSGDFVRAAELGVPDADLIPVNLSFMGGNHVIVEESTCFGSSSSPEGRNYGYGSPSRTYLRGGDMGVVEEAISVESTSPGSHPETLQIYQYFANRTSPSGDRASRKQRKRDKERNGRRHWEAMHFVKIVNSGPTPTRPLQGLWKGICDDMNLEFYLVVYDDIGGITCRRVGDSLESFAGVFWTSNTTFIESPLSSDEEYIYDSRTHLRPISVNQSPFIENDEEVQRFLYINSCFDLVVPGLTESSRSPLYMEGRIWHYASGTFGFGFLRNKYIIDLKHIALDDHLLDTAENCN